MDPQKILFIDNRIIRTIRSVSLIFSLLFAVVCMLIYSDVFTIAGSYHAACIPTALALVILGVMQYAWDPYTKTKVRWYIGFYSLVAALACVFVIGYSTASFLAWLLIIIVLDIYFSRRYSYVGMAIMGTSLTMWMILRWGHMSFASGAMQYVSALAACGVALLVSVIWRLTSESVRDLEVSRDRLDYEHEQLNSLINSMADGVIAVDAQGRIILHNAAALNVMDLNTMQAGEHLSHYLKPVDDTAKHVSITELIHASKTPTINRDLRLKYSDGSFVNLFLAIAPVHLGYRRGNAGAKTSAQGFVLVIRDITREKSLEEERDEFISVVSHELRTPIAISEGNISNAEFIVEKTKDISSVKTALKAAHDQVLFLADMINDLSTLSRAERGVLKLEAEPINVHDLVNELQHNYTPQAEAKGLKLEIELDPSLEILSSSKLYVREVLQNFITNAIKYTQRGSVTIGAKKRQSGVEFYVSDTGIGISKGDQDRVFDKFFRSEDYRTRETNGTGLGLYVTAKLARIIKADINLHSELNHGSTFTISVPNATSDE